MKTTPKALVYLAGGTIALLLAHLGRPEGANVANAISFLLFVMTIAEQLDSDLS